MYWRGFNRFPYQGAFIDCEPGNSKSIVAVYGDETQSHGWTIRSQGHRFPKPDSDLWGIVKDNLLAKPLRFRVKIKDGIQRHPDRWEGTLVGFLATDTYTSVVKDGRVFSLFFHVDWTGDRPPRHLRDITIDLKGIVPAVDYPDRFSLGYCDRFSAKVRKCDPLTYLKIGGSDQSKEGIGEQTCKLFQLIKGNPHQYCSIKLGT